MTMPRIGVLAALLVFVAFWTLSAPHARGEALHVDDPGRLSRFEEAGFDLARLALGSSEPVANNERLFKSAPYRSIVESLTEDLDELKKSDRRLSPSMTSPHRLFDSAWLRSPLATYELVGIVNRQDRAPLVPGSCGEWRFIYRLAYRTTGPSSVYSRLPMTVNAVFRIPRNTKDDCTAAAKSWRSLSPGPPPKLTLKSVEINLQSVRWPSTVRPDMGGYAEYLMRVFVPGETGFVVSGLENTPDLLRLSVNADDRRRLLQWIKTPANLKSLDEGVALIPPEFWAMKATSVALHGSHRMANAPFSRLFSDRDLEGIDFTTLRTMKSPKGVLKRLNDLSCVGCHQGRTVAGFHFLGKDRPTTDDVNSIAVSASPHFLRDRPRRAKFFAEVLSGREPPVFRPLSVRAEQDEGDFGSHCGLGDPSFASWTCRQGLKCVRILTDDRVSPTGVCLPAAPTAGSACQPGRMRHDENPHRDRVLAQPENDCGPSRFCEDSSVGFPAGMCSGGCANLKAGEICGSIAVLQGFNQCLARKKPFASCLRDNVRPGALKACDDERFCRDDYICARTPGGGACIPPYFLFQLRVDGHPSPAAPSSRTL